MQQHTYGKLKALTLSRLEKPSEALLLLHGVGSNAKNMLELGAALAPDRVIISLQAPLVLGTEAYAWFHVQFTAQGPVHNWPEAKESLQLLKESIQDITEKTAIAPNQMAVFGFSQGAIMTIGLALQAEVTLQKYVAASGRTLPEFAQASVQTPSGDYAERKIFVAHGEHDAKLPVTMARDTEKILRSANLNIKYKEYQADHTVPQELIRDARNWLGEK